MPAKTLRSVFKALRQRKSLSQRALAGRVRVTAAYIALIETGARKNPSLDVLKRLAKALDVPVTELLK